MKHLISLFLILITSNAFSQKLSFEKNILKLNGIEHEQHIEFKNIWGSKLYDLKELSKESSNLKTIQNNYLSKGKTAIIIGQVGVAYLALALLNVVPIPLIEGDFTQGFLFYSAFIGSQFYYKKKSNKSLKKFTNEYNTHPKLSIKYNWSF